MIEWTGAGAVPRRRSPAKPCAWCVERFKQPAAFVVKWPTEPMWTDDGPWLPPRRQRMCAFHVRFALQLSTALGQGARAYRFRRQA